jgi:hypothetical protein
MPRNIQAAIKRKEFVEEQQIKPRRKPLKKKAKPHEEIKEWSNRGSLYGLREKRLAIRVAAINTVQITITYKKTTTRQTKKYTVCPYSYRYKKLKIGIRKMLFAYDVADRTIKNYALTNIKDVAVLPKKFVPKWKIEIK